MGLAIDGQIEPMLSSLRVPSGVIVAARTEDPHAADVALSAGDVIHTVNGLTILNLSDLRAALDALEPHSPVVLQVEREGVLTFVAFELD
jgi:S1-C subfamily serine protease